MLVPLLEAMYLYLTWTITGVPKKESGKLAQGCGEILFAQQFSSRYCE